MNVLIMGCGAVGSSFAAFLGRNGHNITAIGRQNHISAILNKDLKVSGIWGNFSVKGINAITEVPQEGDFDAILFCVKSFDTAKSAAAIKHLLLEKVPLISLQNGIGNVETIMEITNHSNVIGGRVIYGSNIPEPGRVDITVYTQPVMLGYFKNSKNMDLPSLNKISSEINSSGIPCETTDKIESYLWTKLIYNAALNPLGALEKVHYGALGENPKWKNIMNMVIEEIFEVAKANKTELFWDNSEGFKELFYSKLLPDTYNHRSSMLQDLEKGRATEIGSLNEIVVKLGKKFGIKTPENSRLTEAIKKAASI